MTTQKNRLPAPAAMGYISGAPAKSGAGRSNPVITLAHDRASGFFCVRRTATPPHYGGACRAAGRLAGF
ncbi:ash family protein [Kosakonia cowanii]|nr:ash family protein [Kosakonia cowanii]